MDWFPTLNPLFVVTLVVNTMIAFVAWVAMYEQPIAERRITLRSAAVLLALLSAGWAVAGMLR